MRSLDEIRQALAAVAPDAGADAMLIGVALVAVADAVLAVAHGDASGPGGLEAVAIAIAGSGLRTPVGSAVEHVADAVKDGQP